MPNNPISPTPNTTQAVKTVPPATPATGTAKSLTTTSTTTKASATEKASTTGTRLKALLDPNQNPGFQFKTPSKLEKATLTGQRIDSKSQNAVLQTIEITFINGDLKETTLKIGQYLGVGIEEVSHSSGASWSAAGEKGIRNNANFDKLSDRTFTLNLQFYDISEDISQLVENLEHLTRIPSGQKSPPLLIYKQGKLLIKPVVCTGLKSTYKNPRFGDKGFMYAEVTLDFMLVAGASSEHALGGPLAPNPLTDTLSQESKAEREKRQGISSAKRLLFDCLGSEGNSQLEAALRDGRYKTVSGVLEMDSALVMQLAIAGMIPKSVLEDLSVKGKISNQVSASLALKESGIGGNAKYEAQLTQYLMGNRSLNSLDPVLTAQTSNGQSLADEIKDDYGVIVESILNQKLADDSPLFNRSAFPTAGERFQSFGSCGQLMRKSDAAKINPDDPVKDAQTLSKLTSFIDKANSKDKTLKKSEQLKAFGLQALDTAKLDQILSRSPYKDKQDFIDRTRDIVGGDAAARVLWASFQAYSEKLGGDTPESLNPETGSMSK
jgi:hypothetical protein